MLFETCNNTSTIPDGIVVFLTLQPRSYAEVTSVCKSHNTGCVIIIDAFLVRWSARTLIGNQTVDGCRRDPRQPSHMVGGE